MYWISRTNYIYFFSHSIFFFTISAIHYNHGNLFTILMQSWIIEFSCVCVCLFHHFYYYLLYTVQFLSMFFTRCSSFIHSSSFGRVIDRHLSLYNPILKLGNMLWTTSKPIEEIIENDFMLLYSKYNNFWADFRIEKKIRWSGKDQLQRKLTETSTTHKWRYFTLSVSGVLPLNRLYDFGLRWFSVLFRIAFH